MKDANIEVRLTDENELHCFKVIFHIQVNEDGERAPMEVYLHATQAADLFNKLGESLLEYFARTSAELLQRVVENHQARELLRQTSNLLQSPFDLDRTAQAEKIDGFLAAVKMKS